MEITKVEFQEVGLDPTKKYIVNLYFAKGTSIEVREHMTRQFKMMLEDNGFTNLIFNSGKFSLKIEVAASASSVGVSPAQAITKSGSAS